VRQNTMKRKLRSGEPALGVSMMVPCPQIVEMIGKLGFDWVMIDCEHGSMSLESVELMIMAAEASGLIPIVRPQTGHPDAIAQVLDRGALGVQVPHINTADDARRAVQSARYYPMGQRGLAVGTRSADYGFGLSMADHVRQANEETLVCIQLEDAEALQNLEAIVQVQGVDVFFVGPSDLSQSMGYPGRPNAPAVRTAISRAFAQIRAVGQIPGSAGTAEQIAEYLDEGCLYLYTHLPRLLAYGTAQFMQTVKTGQRAGPAVTAAGESPRSST
jgi:2-keto-3-deoxy-L-rhamnonate aldolase RhmA